jgi:hypothetical protein
LRRATIIGIVNFVAKGLTVFAPIVAELDEPIPSVIIAIVSLIALITSLTFPNP